MKAQGDPPPTMGEMLHHLHIDPKLIHYNEEDECFYWLYDTVFISSNLCIYIMTLTYLG